MEDAETTMGKAHALMIEAKDREKEVDNAKMAQKDERTEALQLEMCFPVREKE